MKNKYIVVTASCLFLIIAGVCYSCSYKKNRGQEPMHSSIYTQELDEEASNVDSKTELEAHVKDKLKSSSGQEEPMLYVHICGAVLNSNVYQVKTGTRLVDLIDMAGGLKPEAADDYVNQAIAVEDGQRIYIPTKDELTKLSVSDYIAGDGDSLSSEKVSNRVNINTADEAELMRLPGIGQAKARSIIEYRKRNGDFKAVTDLMNISGIKEGLFTQIEELVTVE